MSEAEIDELRAAFEAAVFDVEQWGQHRREREFMAIAVPKLFAEIERLNLEVMRHQVSEGYEAGYEHGTLAALRAKSALVVRLTEALRAYQAFEPRYVPVGATVDNCESLRIMKQARAVLAEVEP